jgi:hypothetical protein
VTEQLDGSAPTWPGSLSAPFARRWMLAWIGAPVIGIVNGAIRRAGYENRLGELAAHQLATATYVAMVSV